MKKDVYVVGRTKSNDFPTKNAVKKKNNDIDAFVTKFSSAGNSLVYATFLGGTGLTLDPFKNVCVTGITISDDFPVINPIQPAHAGYGDVFIIQLNISVSETAGYLLSRVNLPLYFHILQLTCLPSLSHHRPHLKMYFLHLTVLYQ